MEEISDIFIFESFNGGELELVNDDLKVSQGLHNQVYLALFGGNVEESTTENLNELDERSDFWGNEYLTPENQFNSEFEKALNQVALNSSGISKLESAAKKDLQYLSEIANIAIAGSLIGFNKFQLIVELQEPNSQSVKVKFIWDGTRKELNQQ
jgi:phage gp46-like protein